MNKTDKVSIFEEELNKIHNPNMRKWVTSCIELVPDYFFEVGVSSSGKYHPFWSNGKGGLVRHTKAVFDMFTLLCKTTSVSAHEDGVSMGQCAALLHDTFKFGVEYDVRYFDLHPYMPRAMFKSLPWEFDDDHREAIFKAIEGHMGNEMKGEWSLMPYVTKELMQHSLHRCVHMADYIVSRKDYIDARYVGMTFPGEDYNHWPKELIEGLAYVEVCKYHDKGVASIIVSKDEFMSTLMIKVKHLKNDGYRIENKNNLSGVRECISKYVTALLPEINEHIQMEAI